MGSGKSTLLTRNGLIELIEDKNVASVIIPEHKDILQNTNTKGSFGAAIASGYFGDNRHGNGELFFDHSRVILPIQKGFWTNINASYMDGFNCPKQYIATKTPYSQAEIYPFWKMIWEHQSKTIVMLNILTMAGNQITYWHPQKGSSFQLKDLRITTFEINRDHPNFEITKLIVTHKNGCSLLVHHFLYMKWQQDDMLPPVRDFLKFWLKIHSYNQLKVTSDIPKGYNSPIVVHCSDGLERSIVFCAVDISISQFLKTGKVNIFSVVSKLRRDRYDCLKNVDFYTFVYLTLYKYFIFYT